jgi:hypothetical protein
MSKAHRGAGLRPQKRSGRGVCPVCKRESVKVVYEVTANEKKFKICKICKAAVANGTKTLSAAAS